MFFFTLVPAGIFTLGSAFHIPWKENIVLQCSVVGRPPPERSWTFQGLDLIQKRLIFSLVQRLNCLKQ